MSAPKMVYLSPVHAKQLAGTSEMRAENEIEYRLVDPNEKSKIERIRDEVKSLPYRKFSDDHPDQLITKARCLEIIDQISNENDVSGNGGDS